MLRVLVLAAAARAYNYPMNPSNGGTEPEPASEPEFDDGIQNSDMSGAGFVTPKRFGLCDNFDTSEEYDVNEGACDGHQGFLMVASTSEELYRVVNDTMFWTDHPDTSEKLFPEDVCNMVCEMKNTTCDSVQYSAFPSGLYSSHVKRLEVLHVIPFLQQGKGTTSHPESQNINGSSLYISCTPQAQHKTFVQERQILTDVDAKQVATVLAVYTTAKLSVDDYAASSITELKMDGGPEGMTGMWKSSVLAAVTEWPTQDVFKYFSDTGSYEIGPNAWFKKTTHPAYSNISPEWCADLCYGRMDGTKCSGWFMYPEGVSSTNNESGNMRCFVYFQSGDGVAQNKIQYFSPFDNNIDGDHEAHCGGDACYRQTDVVADAGADGGGTEFGCADLLAVKSYNSTVYSPNRGLVANFTRDYGCDTQNADVTSCHMFQRSLFTDGGCMEYSIQAAGVFDINVTAEPNFVSSTYYLDPTAQKLGANLMSLLDVAQIQTKWVQTAHDCCVELVSSDGGYVVIALYAENSGGAQQLTYTNKVCHHSSSRQHDSYNAIAFVKRVSDGTIFKASRTFENLGYACQSGTPSTPELKPIEGQDGKQTLVTNVTSNVSVGIAIDSAADVSSIKACFGLKGDLESKTMTKANSACDGYVVLKSCDVSKCDGSMNTDIGKACQHESVGQQLGTRSTHKLDNGNVLSCSDASYHTARGDKPLPVPGATFAVYTPPKSDKPDWGLIAGLSVAGVGVVGLAVGGYVFRGRLFGVKTAAGDAGYAVW